ncbi:leucyl aminopeptidase [Dolichospermum sp. ST_sed1]|nr:leucyl aminopeptidase [Dolichospermum sp. ST_sed1]MDD1426643.1 leucyl aminopeptidase [Dolichospermum sp. ST_sed9]MDD1433563.1 leucyl aminopeptidase [Dolichospermum sp. ST_sed6]MDD1442575.1 leucyl aminopeptidase [Dolichospermum sp. ST_sed3]MDD1448186.1 leucyl aminopeptidase [Dolichospermum sp. ST_sed8]MDD1456081.1 leucyl aminopeptidase [Dolichospermum sp. ST_sed7]MDD1462335.1 leucyl aminopeptidase [Dolichospermum sp. ST_sed2]MDD1473429.1 leucyl aminopeptidase [Dolichospermum sp. ST_sed4]
MTIQPTNTALLDWTGDTLAVGLFEDAGELIGDLVGLDDKCAGIIKEIIAEEEFKGKANSTIVIRLAATYSVRKVILVGLGKPEALKLETLRRVAAAVARTAKKQKTKTLGISLPLWNNDPATTAQALTEGIELALYQDNRFKSEIEDKNPPIETIDLLGLAGQEAAITRANQIVAGVILARQLVAAPANSVTSITMAETAQAIAHEHGLELEILDQEECEKLGMGAFLGVAQASDLPPKFIHLIYKPATTPRRKLAIIGKGVTFDSGGLNIKGAGSGIETMKMDMGGAAATLGAAKAIGQLKPDVEVHFISAVTENMISGKAMHPGDILTASNGKTIEVNNTDAEGRLTLADALVYADKLGVDAIVDLATLTGACVVALGEDIAGLFTPDDAVASQLQTAADSTGEKIWRMPMEDKYFEGLKSGIADMKNTGPRYGGSITAALFLKQFVKDTPWAHLDIAGPVWAEKENGYNGAGATGFGVRTLVSWVLS